LSTVPLVRIASMSLLSKSNRAPLEARVGLRGGHGPHEAAVGGEAFEAAQHAIVQAVAHAQHHHQHEDAPAHPEHGEEAAQLVAAQRHPDLVPAFAIEHGSLSIFRFQSSSNLPEFTVAPFRSHHSRKLLHHHASFVAQCFNGTDGRGAARGNEPASAPLITSTPTRRGHLRCRPWGCGTSLAGDGLARPSNSPTPAHQAQVTEEGGHEHASIIIWPDDVARRGAQGLADADLLGAVLHHDEHDVARCPRCPR
jgi:hypothetical protein